MLSTTRDIRNYHPYCFNGALDGLRGELHLVDVKLLVHHVVQLHVVHFSTSQHVQCLVLQVFISCAFSRLHLVLDAQQLLVALIDFDLDHFASIS
jgi:hypothetical protein